jgi:hypothetical protein
VHARLTFAFTDRHGARLSDACNAFVVRNVRDSQQFYFVMRCVIFRVKHISCYNYLNLCSQEFERRQTSGPQPSTRYRKNKVIKEVLPDDTDFYEDPSSTLHLSGLSFLSNPRLVLPFKSKTLLFFS